MKNWFFKRVGEQYGPFTADELRQMAAIGDLCTTDLVWRDGMIQPVEARFVPTLFSISQATTTSSEKRR